MNSRYSLVTISEAGIATLQITEAGSMNVLNSAVISDLTRTLKGLCANPRVRVLVLRGTGDKAFIGGADIKEMVQLNVDTATAFITGLFDLCEAVRSFSTPVIARLSGWCLGGGLIVAAVCDIRVASTTAKFGMPEVKLGVPSTIQSIFLSRLIGEGNARWMLLTGQTIDASVAVKWNLVNAVVEPEDLDKAVSKVAADILECNSPAIRTQKELLRSWEAESWMKLMKQSRQDFAAAFKGDEARQLMQKFLDRKRS